MSVSSFYPLLFQYPILSTLAQNLSALDLFHLSLASKTAHSLIQPSKSVFTALTRESLCDGHGLIARQELKGPYDFVTPGRYVWGNSRKIHHDEPIEVNLWAQKCDEANALPCIKCGVNICEECRYLDRVALKAGKLYRKPFPHPNWEHDNFIGLCPKCDLETQRRISGKHLYEDCVCDVWDRWICFKCYCKEEEAIGRYFREHTKLAHDFYYDSDENVYDYERPPIEKTKVIPVHQAALEVWCLCGAPVPRETRLRCAWCERRLPPEEKWGEAADAIEQMRCLDPTYPRWTGWNGAYDKGQYPKLPYEGPIWTEEERRRHVDSVQQEQHQ